MRDCGGSLASSLTLIRMKFPMSVFLRDDGGLGDRERDIRGMETIGGPQKSAGAFAV
jgi:hypothetical protein